MTAPSPSSPPTNGAPTRPTTLVVRRDVRRDLRSSLILLGVAGLLVFWIPAVIVLVRPEAAYFTNGILWTALIATVAMLLIGAALTVWWSRRGRVILTADSGGVRLPGRRKQPAFEARWDDLSLVRLVGTRDPALAFYLRPVADEPADESAASDGLDLSEPEFLRPLDFANDPPPAMRAPDRSTFDEITPADGGEEPAETTPPAPRLSPAEVLHGTPHVVQLVRTNPSLTEILRALTRLSAGRVRLE